MKSRGLLLTLVVFLILVLTGCKIIPLCCTEEMRARQEVYSYWQAIINRRYELAKYYCIIDGVWYNNVDEWEEYIDINTEGEASVVIHGPSFYKQIEIIGDIAFVYVRIFVDKIPFLGSCAIYSDNFEYEIELIKETSPPTDWKLK